MIQEKLTENSVLEFAEKAIEFSGLEGWDFRIGNTLSAVAVCRYDIRRIEFSRNYIGRISKKGMEEAIHHEIAHVVAGPDADHGTEWKEVMRSFGYPEPSRFIQVWSVPPHRFGIYKEDTLVESFYRKPRRKLEDGLEVRAL
jgi:hypothetical protein